MTGKRGRSGGARRDSGRKKGTTNVWIMKRFFPVVLDFNLDSIENIIKAIAHVADLVLKNRIDRERALAFNSLARTLAELLIPTEQEMKLRILEEKTARHEELVRRLDERIE